MDPPKRSLEPFDLAETIDSASPSLRDIAPRAGMTLEIERTSGDPLAVIGDRAAVERIAHNLVDRATMTVIDHGPGVRRAEAEQVFRPFRKSASEAAHSAPGVGLGLALCRRLAREMGGDLVLDPPPPGGGASFTLSVPVDSIGSRRASTRSHR